MPARISPLSLKRLCESPHFLYNVLSVFGNSFINMEPPGIVLADLGMSGMPGILYLVLIFTFPAGLTFIIL